MKYYLKFYVNLIYLDARALHLQLNYYNYVDQLIV